MRQHLRPRITGTVAALAGAAGLLLAMPFSASADPVNPPNRGLISTLHCKELGDVTAIQEGNGLWTRTAMPWHALDSNLVLTVYAVHFEFTPTGGDFTVVDASKPAPQGGRLDVCTQHEQGPQGVFDGTYRISYNR
jgi:hypothetical protein